MKTLFLFLISISVFSQTVWLRDNSPQFMVNDWTIGASTNVVFTDNHGLSVNERVNCWGFQSQPNLNGDFLVAATPAANTITLKTLAGDPVQTYNVKFKTYNYNADQHRTPSYQASCGKVVAYSIHAAGPLGMVPPPGTSGRVWIDDPDGPGPLSAPAMTGAYAAAITKNANDYSSEVCNPDLPLSTSNCSKEFSTTNSEVIHGYNPYTVALAWYMNQQNTRWKNSARAYLNNLHNLAVQTGRFTAADTIVTHGNRGEASDTAKLAIRNWAMAYSYMESVLSEPEKLAVEQKLWNDDEIGCENLLPNPSGESNSTGTNRLTLDDATGWQVGDWGLVRNRHRKFKVSDGTILTPITVSGTTATVTLSAAHTPGSEGSYVKITGSGVEGLEGTFKAKGETTITFTVSGVSPGSYTHANLEIYTYALVPNTQGTWFRVTAINGNELSTSVDIPSATNSPYAKRRPWSSNSCGMHWLIRHHDASVPMDVKATFIARYPLAVDSTTINVPPTYAGVLRGWTPPFIVTAGSEQMLATDVFLPDDTTSDAIITVERGYNTTPIVVPINSSVQFILSKSGRVAGESTTPGSMWVGSAYQNLRMTDLGGVIPAAAAFSRQSDRVRGIFEKWYNVYRDYSLRWAQTHWAGNNPAATNPGYFYGRQSDQVIPACLAAANTVTSADVLQTCRSNYDWIADLHSWIIHVTQPYNKRYRMVFSDAGTARFIEGRHHNQNYMSYLSNGIKSRWGNFHNRRITGQAFNFLGANNRTLPTAVMYEPYIQEDDYRTSAPLGDVWFQADPEARAKGYGLGMLSSRTSYTDPDATAVWSYAFAPQGDHLGTYNSLAAYQITKRGEMICTGTVGCLSHLSQSGVRIFSPPNFTTLPAGTSTVDRDIYVKLSSPAPVGGVAVELSSGDPAAAVPGWVTVPAGEDTATVPSLGYMYSGQQEAVITGESANTRTALLVSPNQFNPGSPVAGTIANVTFESSSVAQGGYVLGTVTLSAPATGAGVDVSMTAASGLKVTPTVRVRNGLTSAKFFVAASPSASGTLAISAQSTNTFSTNINVDSTGVGTGLIAAIITGRDSRVTNGFQTNGIRTSNEGGPIAKVLSGGAHLDYTWWQVLGQEGPTQGFYTENSMDYHLRHFFHLRPEGGQDYSIVHNVVKNYGPGREVVDRIAFYRGNSLELSQEAVVPSTTQVRDGNEITFIKPVTTTRPGGASITTKILLPDAASITDDFSKINTSTSYGAALDIHYGNDANEYREGLWVHKANTGTSPTMVQASLVETTSPNITALRIEGSPFNYVVTFPKRHTPLTSLTLSETTSNTGPIYFTGLEPGTWTVSRNGGAAFPHCVIGPNKVLRSSMVPGVNSFILSHVSSDLCQENMWWITRTLPDQLQNTPFKFRFVTEGGSGNQTYSLDSGTLPTGLTLASDGTLEGATAQTGTFNFMVKSDDTINSAARSFSLKINPASGALTITNDNLPGGFQGTAYTVSINAAGGTVPYTFKLAGEDPLPPGLEINAAGVISGTPSEAGVFSFAVEVEDATEETVTKDFTIIILEPAGELSITTESILNGTVGTPLSFQLAALGGTPSYTWSILSGTLPDGINLSSSGLLSGTPTEDGVFNVTYRVTDSNSVQAQKALSLTIEDTPPTPIGNIDVGVKAAGTVGLVTFRKAGLDANQSCTVEVFNNLNQLVDSAISASGLAVRTVAISSLVALQVFRAEVTCGEDNGYSVFSPEQVSGTRDFTLEFKPEAGISSVTVEWGPPGNMNQSTTQPCSGGCTITLPGINRGSVLDVRYTLQAPSSIRKVLVR